MDRVAGGNGLTKVTQGTTIFYIYPKERQDGTFTGSLANNSGVLSSIRSRGLNGLAGIRTIVENKNNPQDVQEVTTASDGSFTVPNAIPGDTYEVVPVIDGVEETPVEVLPLDSGSDVGTVAVVDTAYNFKATTSYPVGQPFLFADGTTEYTLTIRIQNSGTALSNTPIWSVSSGTSGLVLSGTLMNTMQSIEPDNFREFTVKVKADPITDAYEDKTINIELEVLDGPTWTDSVTIRFYKNERMMVYLGSDVGIRAAVISPDGRLIPFGGSWGGTSELEIPRWIEGAKVVLSGATTSTETKYSLSVGRSKGFSTDYFVHPTKDEPNNLPGEATPVYINDVGSTPLYGYLRPNDMDYFEIKDESGPAITIDSWAAGKLSVSWEPVVGAEKYNVWLNGVLQTASGQIGTSISNLSVGAGFDLEVRATVAGKSGPATRKLVFYDKGDSVGGWRYLEAMPYDLWSSSTEPYVTWWNGSSMEIVGAKGTDIGTGAANTIAIVEEQGAGTYAASLCDAVVFGGHDDWFLPSKDELNLMYTNLKAPGLGGFVGGSFWSSSQNSYNVAWAQYFYSGDQYGINTNGDGYFVRAVRAF